MKVIISKSSSANNTNKSRTKSPKQLGNERHKEQTISFGAICRYIDKQAKLNLLDQEGFKPLAIESINKNGAFKTLRPLLNEKEETKLVNKKAFSYWTLSTIANRIDTKAKEDAKKEAEKVATKQAIKNNKK